MNSFRRRMVHKIGTKYKLTSESKGEGINRSVSLIKTEQTKIPENNSAKPTTPFSLLPMTN